MTDNQKYTYNHTRQGLSRDIIEDISTRFCEPDWVKEIRYRAYEMYLELPLPSWGPDLSQLDLSQIITFAQRDTQENRHSWEDVPQDIKDTFDALWIPEAEKRYLGGSGVQYDSQSIHHTLKQELIEKGVIFTDLHQAIQQYPDLVQKYFTKAITLDEHKFSALHYALWTWGTFLYVPKGVILSEPLQSYFRMNIASGGQFEHTIIILEEQSSASYIEGCSAPKYGESALHAGGVEVFLAEGAQLKYTSIENWSTDVYNLNTKKAIVQKDAKMEWIGGNMGSKVSMLYPCSVLVGQRAKTRIISLAWAREWQIIDGGGKTIHLASDTEAIVMSRSLAQEGGRADYRGSSYVAPDAYNTVLHTECDSLLLDDISRSDAFPSFVVENAQSELAHEASVGKLNEDEVFYLQSRGVDQESAKTLLVGWFLSPIFKEFPFEYATEMNLLLSLLFKKSKND